MFRIMHSSFVLIMFRSNIILRGEGCDEFRFALGHWPLFSFLYFYKNIVLAFLVMRIVLRDATCLIMVEVASPP